MDVVVEEAIRRGVRLDPHVRGELQDERIDVRPRFHEDRQPRIAEVDQRGLVRLDRRREHAVQFVVALELGVVGPALRHEDGKRSLVRLGDENQAIIADRRERGHRADSVIGYFPGRNSLD